MSKRTQFNIGETGKTSVKVHNNPGGQSNWSLGWSQEQKPKTTIKKYHNESSLVLGGKNEEDNEQEMKKKELERKLKEENLNKNLPQFDPKKGGQSSVNFGDEKTDYSTKYQYYNTKVSNPPGGKSNVQFG